MKFTSILRFLFKFLFCTGVILLSVKGILEMESQSKTLIKNWSKLSIALKLTNPSISNTIVKYAPNIVLIMNIGFIAAAFLSLINYKKDKAFLLFISLCIQLLFINNSYFEKKTNVFMMSSAYIGIFSALMSLDE